MIRVTQIPHEETIGKTLMLFTQTCRLMSKYMDAFFYQKAHISFTKFMALKLLASKNGLMTQTQIADWTQTELHNITTLVARLKKEGLVTTERSDIDKRNVNVILTDEGRKTLSRAKPLANEFINKIMQSITETDAEKLTEMIEVLRDNAYSGLESLDSKD